MADREAVVAFTDGCAVARLPLSTTEQGILDAVRKKLEGSQDYRGKVKAWFDLLLVRLCKFLTSRTDASAFHGHMTYLSRVGDRRELPGESALQFDLYNYLLSAMPSVLLEAPNVASGRTDIYLPFDGFRFIIEVKRATAKAWSCFSVRPHSKQASAYSSTDVRIGVLATLDLSIREPGVPHVSDCLGVIKRRHSRNDERAVVIMRIPGNRASPSSLSR